MNERFITHFENNEATRSQAEIYGSVRPFVEVINDLLKLDFKSHVETKEEVPMRILKERIFTL